MVDIQTATGRELDKLAMQVGIERHGETDGELRERVISVGVQRLRGTASEVKEVLGATMRDLERNLAQVMPVALTLHLRIVAQVNETGEVFQVDGGAPKTTKSVEPPPQPAKPAIDKTPASCVTCGHEPGEHIKPYGEPAPQRCNALGCECPKYLARMDPNCTGAGKCHGSLQWCNMCGDVGEVCDAEEGKCDSHKEALQAKRERELLRSRKQEATW